MKTITALTPESQVYSTVVDLNKLKCTGWDFADRLNKTLMFKKAGVPVRRMSLDFKNYDYFFNHDESTGLTTVKWRKRSRSV